MKWQLAVLLFQYFSFQVIGQPFYHAKKQAKLMGCFFEITAVADSDSMAWKAVEIGIDEISRIERLISSWDEESQTSLINESAGIASVSVDRELFDLIVRALKVSQLTDGAFDISFASMDRIWDFNRMEQTIPDNQDVSMAASKINWQKIMLDDEKSSVFLNDKGMKIGFGAIGKGYAANRARDVMSSIEGVQGGLVNASGDLITWGTNGKPEGWRVQIADPKQREKSLGWISTEDMAIVTSGDYEKYFTSDGVRYAHIINPNTGYPVTGIKSVTILCPDAELADALATSVFVLGTEKGLYLVNQLRQVECIIVTDEDEILSSENLMLNYY